MIVVVKLGEIIGFFLLFLFGIIWMVLTVKQKIRQTFCFHTKYHETMACNAVCDRCGKNLGFIGTVREKSK